MELREHEVPKHRLELIPPVTTDILVGRLNALEGSEDDNHREILLRDIISTLVACDTSTYTGNDFEELNNTIKELLLSGEGAKELSAMEFPYDLDSWGRPRTGLAIFPKELQPQMNEVLAKYMSDTPTKDIVPTPLPIVLIHAHGDTIQRIYDSRYGESFATLSSFVDPQTGLMYGCGVQDMKAAIAALIMSSKSLLREKELHPVMMFTFDEERRMDMGGLRSLRCMISEIMNLDTEPNAGHPITNSRGIMSSVGLIWNSRLNLPIDKLNLLQDEMRTFYPDNLPMISYTMGDLRLSIHEEDKQKHEGMKNTLATLADVILGIGNYQGYFENDGVEYHISERNLEIINKILLPYQNGETHGAISRTTKTLREEGSALVRHYTNFDHALRMAYAGIDGYEMGNIGYDEEGGARHHLAEAVKLKQVNQLEKVIVEYMQALHMYVQV